MTTQTTANPDLDIVLSLVAYGEALRAWKPIERPQVARLDAWARLCPVIKVGRETTFTPAGVSLRAYKDSEGTVRNPEVAVHGEMTFKDRRDSGARVVISESGAYCVSTAWDGSSFKEMPAGARKRVAEAVSDGFGLIDWTAVGVEFFAGARNAEVSGRISEAVRALEAAVRATVVP